MMAQPGGTVVHQRFNLPLYAAIIDGHCVRQILLRQIGDNMKQKLNAEAIAKALYPESVRAGNGWNSKCPTHNDAISSLSLTDVDDGKVLVKCHAGCPQSKVIAELKRRGLWPGSEIVAEYSYQSSDEVLLFQMVRLEDKGFNARRPDKNGTWIYNVTGVELVPYRLPQLIDAIANGRTVFVAEGEKDVETLAKLGLVATTNAFGAKRWKSCYAKYFKDASVSILPDNDAVGKEHADEVANSLAGIAKSVKIVALPNLPDKGDVSDWVDAGGTMEQLLALCEAAPRFEPKPERVEKHGDCEVSTKGLYVIADDGQRKYISNPIWVTAKCRDVKSDNWSVLCEWNDADGCVHRRMIPNSMLLTQRDEVIRILSSGGLEMLDANKVVEYLRRAQPKERIRFTDKVGWNGSVYVLPHKTIGKSVEQIEFDCDANFRPHYGEEGSLEEWRQSIGKFCIGNSRLVTAVSTAFAAPLIEPMKEESGGLHFVGKGSSGKTTALQLASSVFGGPGYTRSWRSTSNGLESIAKAHNDSLLVLDELGQMNQQEAGQAAYMLANGKGKQRSSRDGNAKGVAEWRILLLSSGELTLSGLMSEGNKTSRAGQETRLAEVPADAGADMGIFENIHGHKSAAAFAETLAMSCMSYFGTPGIEFITRLSQDDGTAIRRVKVLSESFVKQWVPEGASGQCHRVGRRFALIAAAGELATEFGITGWTPGEALNGAKRCFLDWMEARGGSGQLEELKILEAVRGFLSTQANRFRVWSGRKGQKGLLDDKTVIINEAGVKRRNENNDHYEFSIYPPVFRKELCREFDPKTVADLLIGKGYMKTQLDRGKPVSPVSVQLPGKQLLRMYVITSAIFTDGLPEPEPEDDEEEHGLYGGPITADTIEDVIPHYLLT